MKLKMYCIYDTKTGTHTAPVPCINAPDALRVFTGVFVGDRTTYAKFPADYSVVQIGTFDDQTGSLEHTEKTLLVTGAELVAEYNKSHGG